MSARRSRPRRFLWELAVGILAVTAAGYVILALAPAVLARLVPSAWWAKLGEAVEVAFVEDAQRCSTPEGDAALAALMQRLDAEVHAAPARVGVFRIPVANAWALPGRRIVLTSELLAQAGDADEVAGVLAHEIGHLRSLHAEMQIIREIGVNALSGASNGDGLAGALAVLRYSRAAEREADAIAADLLIAARIDTAAMGRFLERMARSEGGGSGLFGRLFDIMSTHPVTAERIAAVPAVPAGLETFPALATNQWRALQKICG